MDISVIIVNYRLAEFIKKHLCLLWQESVPLEVIIIDNSCHPKETAILNELAKHPLVKIIINQKNKGFAFACNQGVKIASGRYIFFLNPDAYITKGALKTLLYWAEKLNADAIGPKIFLDEKLSFPQPPAYPSTFLNICLHCLFPRLYSYFWRYYSERFWQAEKPIKVNFLSGAAFMIKKELATFDERFFLYFEDTDLFLRLKKTEKKVYFCPQAKVVHLFDLSPSTQKLYHLHLSEKQFYAKHYPYLKHLIFWLQKHKITYKDKQALCLKDYLKQNLPSCCIDISTSADFVPFIRGKLNPLSLPSAIQRMQDKLWVRIISLRHTYKLHL